MCDYFLGVMLYVRCGTTFFLLYVVGDVWDYFVSVHVVGDVWDYFVCVMFCK